MRGELGENPKDNCDFCMWREGEPARGAEATCPPWEGAVPARQGGQGSMAVGTTPLPTADGRGLWGAREGSTLTLLFSFPALWPG